MAGEGDPPRATAMRHQHTLGGAVYVHVIERFHVEIAEFGRNTLGDREIRDEAPAINRNEVTGQRGQRGDVVGHDNYSEASLASATRRPAVTALTTIRTTRLTSKAMTPTLKSFTTSGRPGRSVPMVACASVR